MFRQGCLSLTTLVLTFVLAAALQSCSSDGKKWDPEDYTVKSGDTIYSIAWRYELDPEEFAAWNGVQSSKFIKAGQRLHTRKPANFDANIKDNREQAIAYAPTPTSRQPVNKKWIKAEKGDTLMACQSNTASASTVWHN